MFRLILLAIICFAGPLRAQVATCPPPELSLGCFESFVCIGDSGLSFHEIRGHDVAGTLSNGASCTSMNTLVSNKFMMGRLALDCTDGTQVSVSYDRQKVGDFFSYGEDRTDQGHMIRAWVTWDMGYAYWKAIDTAQSLSDQCPERVIRTD